MVVAVVLVVLVVVVLVVIVVIVLVLVLLVVLVVVVAMLVVAEVSLSQFGDLLSRVLGRKCFSEARAISIPRHRRSWQGSLFFSLKIL